jgi:hypothetical protein
MLILCSLIQCYCICCILHRCLSTVICFDAYLLFYNSMPFRCFLFYAYPVISHSMFILCSHSMLIPCFLHRCLSAFTCFNSYSYFSHSMLTVFSLNSHLSFSHSKFITCFHIQCLSIIYGFFAYPLLSNYITYLMF